MNYADRTPLPPAAPAETDAGLTLLGHDVRAAVSDIVGGLRLVSPDGLDAERRAQLERARASGEELARLLDDGLTLVGGEAPADPAGRVQLSRLLYDTQMRWSGRAREKGIGFRLSAGTGLPQVLSLDRVALDRVLSNMLSNAIKYTDAGQVELAVRLAPGGGLAFSVTDQGPGFSSDAMARLFDFGGRPAGAGKPGQGLGMHISLAMSSRLGGTLTAGNLADGGARVTLDLPAASWQAQEAHARPEPLPDLTGLKVLVADDNATNRTILTQMLGRMGAATVTATDGFEALDRLLLGRFDLVLVDIEMPHLSGIEVIRWLKAGDTPHPAVPVVAITAHVLRANRDAIHAAGADAILPKPFGGIEGLGMTLEHVLSEAPTVAKAPAADASVAPALDRLIRAAGPENGRELLTQLSVDLRNVERDLSDGIGCGDMGKVRASTHILISLAGVTGADPLLALSRKLNLCAHRGETAAFADMGPEALGHLGRLIAAVDAEHRRHEDA